MIIQIKLQTLKIQCSNYLLRPLEESDFNSFQKYLEINGYQHAQDEIKQMLNDTIGEQSTLGIFMNQELIGAIQFVDSNEKLPIIDEAKGICFGYSVRKDLRNQGIMKQALKTVIDYFSEIEYFYAATTKDNEASIHVLQDNGFQCVKEDDFMHWMLVNENQLFKRYQHEKVLSDIEVKRIKSNLNQQKGPYKDEYVDFRFWYKQIPSRQVTFMNYLIDEFHLNKNDHILEVGSGKDAILSTLLSEKGYHMTCIDPLVNEKQQFKTIKEYFDYQTFNLDSYDCVIAQEPCEATEHIVRACMKKNLPFVIALCGVPHHLISGEKMKDVFEWYGYLRGLTGQKAHFEILDFGCKMQAFLLVNP